MTLTQFLRIILRYWKLIVSTAVLLFVVVYIATLGEEEQFVSKALINTGIVSGYNIESQNSSRTDYTYTNNEILNLINLASSNETMLDLSKHLTVSLIRNHQNDTLINAAKYKDFVKELPVDIVQKIEAAANDSIAMVILEEQIKPETNSEFYERIHSDDPFIGLEHLEGLKVEREGTSDMIRITYQTIDPGVCQKTIQILIKLFIGKHRALKQNQTTNVLEFFEKSTKDAANVLSSAETELLNFQEENRIINYYEQTRYISGKKEDLDEQYYKELMNSVSADSSIKKIEKELSKYVSLPQIYREIDSIRRNIAQNNRKLMALDIREGNHDGELTELKLNDKQLNKELKNAALRSVSNSYTTEGVETKDLLSKWLDQLILREQSAARIQVMNARKNDFERLYERFAPLGSRLKHIERKIDVSEKEYLENLHSLNQAQLHKYNMMISSNLSIVDQPNYPALPEKSKRGMMLILGALAGAILSLSTLIALELLDQTIRNPERASSQIGHEVITAIPLKDDSVVGFQDLLKKSIGLFVQYIMVDAPATDEYKMTVVSTRAHEGKSEFIRLYKEFAPKNFKADFIELPALLQDTFDLQAIRSADYVILIVQANRIWSKADAMAIERLMKAKPNNLRIVLNGLAVDEMEGVLGEVPKKRSKFRKWVKRIMRQELHTEGIKIA